MPSKIHSFKGYVFKGLFILQEILKEFVFFFEHVTHTHVILNNNNWKVTRINIFQCKIVKTMIYSIYITRLLKIYVIIETIFKHQMLLSISCSVRNILNCSVCYWEYFKTATQFFTLRFCSYDICLYDMKVFLCYVYK